MNPLLGKAALRIGVLCAYCTFVAWIFTIIERNDESGHERMEKMLKDLKTEVAFKYNMTDNDFDSFIASAAAALSTGDKLDWTFLNSGGFVLAALTTVGKTSDVIYCYWVRCQKVIDGIWLDFLSAFHSTKIPKFSNGTEISRESFQKIRELLNLGKANYSTEDSGNSRMKIKLNGKFQYTSGDCFL